MTLPTGDSKSSELDKGFVGLTKNPYIESAFDKLPLKEHFAAYLIIYLSWVQDWVSSDELAELFYTAVNYPKGLETSKNNFFKHVYPNAEKLLKDINLEGFEIRPRKSSIRLLIPNSFTRFNNFVSLGDWEKAYEERGDLFLKGYRYDIYKSDEAPEIISKIESFEAEFLQKWQEATRSYSEELVAKGKYGKVVEVLKNLVDSDPLNEINLADAIKILSSLEEFELIEKMKISYALNCES